MSVPRVIVRLAGMYPVYESCLVPTSSHDMANNGSSIRDTEDRLCLLVNERIIINNEQTKLRKFEIEKSNVDISQINKGI